MKNFLKKGFLYLQIVNILLILYLPVCVVSQLSSLIRPDTSLRIELVSLALLSVCLVISSLYFGAHKNGGKLYFVLWYGVEIFLAGLTLGLETFLFFGQYYDLWVTFLVLGLICFFTLAVIKWLGKLGAYLLKKELIAV